MQHRLDGTSYIKKELDDLKENVSDLHQKTAANQPGVSLKDTQNQMSVTLTLTPSAAENIGGVISAIADLLKIAVPPTYDMNRSPSPEMYKSPAVKREYRTLGV